jgi:hypothetical protein
LTISAVAGGEAILDHNSLYNRDAINQHPIGSITGLQTALTGINALTNGWIPLPTTLSFSSADRPTGVATTGSDTRGYLNEGMKIKYDQAESLTAYWNLDSNSISQVGSFNGTDTAVIYSAGKFGNGASFNGTSSKIVLTDNSALKPTGAFTIGCWFKTNSTGSAKLLYQSRSMNTNYAGIVIYINSSNTITTEFGNNTQVGANNVFVTTTNICDNNWHYITVAYNNNYAQIYIDGKLQASGYAVTPAYATTNYVRIGCGNVTGTDTFFMNGQIDDLFIINGYALDEKTIRDKYNSQTAQGIEDITVTKMAFISANPTVNSLTLYHGTDYMLSNKVITNVFYSNIKLPFGFPLNPNKWSVLLKDITNITFSTPTDSVWYNALMLTVPIGQWEIECKHAVRMAKTTGALNMFSTISTINNSETDYDLTSVCWANNVPVFYQTLYRNKKIQTNVKTNIYLNFRSTSAGLGLAEAIGVRGDYSPTILMVTSTYL